MVLWGRSVLGRQKFRGRFHQRSTKLLQVSLRVWFSGGDPFWAAKRFRGRLHQGSTKLLQASLCLWFSGADPGLPKVPREKVPPRFHQASPSLVVSLVLWGRSVLGCQKVPRKVPPRFREGSAKVPPTFHQASPSFVVSLILWGRSVGLPKGSAEGSTKVPPSFSKFRCVSDSLGQIRLGLPKGSAEGSTKVPPTFSKFRGLWFSGVDLSWAANKFCGRFTKVPSRFRQGSTKLLQVSLCLWFSGADPSWAAKRFSGRFHQGSAKVPPRFRQPSPSFVVSGSLGWICLGLPKSSVEGSPRFHRGSTKVPSRFHQGSTKVPPRFHQGCTKVVPTSHQGSTLRSGA